MMNGYPKFVVSTTLEEAGWNNSTIIEGNVAEEVSKLKQRPGKDILIFGSGDLVNTLMQHDLIDEYRLMIFPVVLGSGQRLFRDGSDTAVIVMVDPHPGRGGFQTRPYDADHRRTRRINVYAQRCRTALRLVDTTTFGSGVVVLTYQPDG